MGLVIVIFVLLSILTFLILWLNEIRGFNRTGSARFSFLTYLPYEINRFKRDQKSSYIYPFVQVAGSIFLAVPSYLFAIMVQQNGGSIVPCYVFAGLLTLALIAYNFLTFIKLSAYKLHMVFVTIFVSLTLGLDALYLFFCTSNNYMFINGIMSQGMQIAIFVIMILLMIFEFVLMLNRSYKNWAKMVKVDAETFNRPKRCYLAILEWGTFLNLVLTYIPVFIILYF
ncbi:MAG: hypothetical protein J6X03_02485 [Bacilli bacterium]|nr:hypothetical protein [Bacilli bacterium]